MIKPYFFKECCSSQTFQGISFSSLFSLKDLFIKFLTFQLIEVLGLNEFLFFEK